MDRAEQLLGGWEQQHIKAELAMENDKDSAGQSRHKPVCYVGNIPWSAERKPRLADTVRRWPRRASAPPKKATRGGDLWREKWLWAVFS